MISDPLPDALRPTELHDFGDLFRERHGRLNRPLMVMLAAALLLAAGHFAYHSLNVTQSAAASATGQQAPDMG
ncbi:MAG TPA: hypothetical protein VIG49_10985 [Acetobacteraceae bacterium]|jgi:hypothetical protein